MTAALQGRSDLPPILECPVCRSQDLRPRFQKEGFRVSRCQLCSHLFVAVTVPEEMLAAAYGSEYYGGDCRNSCGELTGYEDYLGSCSWRIATFRDRMSILSAYAAPGRLLDYGCAIGLFVKVAIEAGWDGIGYERSG